MNSGDSASNSSASAHATLSAVPLFATGASALVLGVVPVVGLLRGLILIPPGCG